MTEGPEEFLPRPPEIDDENTLQDDDVEPTPFLMDEDEIV